MSKKTVITCDHCGKEIHNNCDERFSHMGCNAAFAMGTIDACSREHLGLALAKAFGLPIDTKAADLFVEHAKSEARRVFLEAEVKRLGAQIGEIEQQERRAGELLAKAHPSHVAAEARVAELEKRIAELTAPVTVDGKTPGQVLFRAQHKSLSWDGQDEIEQEQYEKEAHAVLCAFGNSPPRQTPQANTVEALRRVRKSFAGYQGECAAVVREAIDDELAKLEAKTAGKAPECFLCGKGPHDHTMMVLESLPEQFEVKWCNGRRQNFGTEKPAWWDVPKSDHVHELKSCSFCDKSPPDTSTESGLPDAVLAAITLPTKPTKPLRDAIAPRDIIVIVEEPPIECDECGQTNGSHALWCGT